MTLKKVIVQVGDMKLLRTYEIDGDQKKLISECKLQKEKVIKEKPEKVEKPKKEEKVKKEQKSPRVLINDIIDEESENKDDMFGISNESFSCEKLIDILQTNNFIEAKNYVRTYFAKMTNPVGCICVWEPTDSTSPIKIIKFTDINSYIPNGVHFVYQYNDRAVRKQVNKWFIDEEVKTYQLETNLKKPIVYRDNGRRMINSFQGFVHSSKKRRDITNDERKGIDLFWNHARNILCGGNEECFELLKKSVCKMVNGHKIKIAFYLKSEQGTGKGLFMNFLMTKIIGMNNSYYNP